MRETIDYESRTERDLILETLDRTRRLNSAARVLLVMGGLCVFGIAICVIVALQVLWQVIELTTALGTS